MAVGARPLDIWRLVLAEILTVMFVGCTVGAALTVAGVRLVSARIDLPLPHWDPSQERAAREMV
jgi:hypothetical protein